MPMNVFGSVKAHWEEIKHLPLDERFTADDVDATGIQVYAWEDAGIITPVDTTDHPKKPRKIYVVTEAASQFLEDYDPRFLLPCGHRGFRNLGAGQYTCGYEECDAIHTRDVVEAAVGVTA